MVVSHTMNCLQLCSYIGIKVKFIILYTELSSTTNKLQDHFSDFYKRIRYTPNKAEWPPNQSRVIVNVALMHSKSGNVKESIIRMSKIHRNTIGDNLDSSDCDGPSTKRFCLDDHKVTKEIIDIFAADQGENGYCEPPRRILIEGAPGIGKTVLAKEIAYNWAIGELLQDIKVLFLLFLRDPRLRDVSKVEELVEYLTINCGLSKDEVQSCTAQLMHTRIGFVLDGLDEYDSKNNSFFIDLIMGKIFINALVVCTSRPTVTLQLHDCVDRRIEILGLPEEEQNNYIEKSLADMPGKKEELDKYLTRNLIIKSLCCVPLHLAILLYLFKQGSLPETLTEINESFIIHTIYRNLEKNSISIEATVDQLKNLPKEIFDFIYKLSEVAYNGLKEHKIVFTFDKVQNICPNIMEMPGAVNGFGLLQAVQHYPEVGVGRTMSFNFLHFTMQEFLAAFFISILPSEEQSTIIERTFWDEHYTFMWMMYVGIVGTDSDVFLKFINSESLSDIEKDKINCVHLLQCCSEAKNNQVPDKISSVFGDKIELAGRILAPYTFWSIISFMYKSDIQTRYSTLVFQSCLLDTDQMNLLYQFVINNPEKTSALGYVNLNFSRVSPWNVFCAVIRHSLVKNLTLYGGRFDHAEELATSLSCNFTLNSLTLIMCGYDVLGLSELQSIKNVLVTAKTSLRELNLSWEDSDIENINVLCSTEVENSTTNHNITINILDNKTSDHTDQFLDLSNQLWKHYQITSLAFILEGRNRIKILDISCNELIDDRVEAIRYCLLNNDTLLELNMSNCKISGEDIANIIDASKTLQVLDVSYNNIYDDEADLIGACTITSLQKLNISHNYITGQGATFIAQVISKNTSLQELDISHNNIQDYGSIAIGEHLKFNKTLQYINLSYNKITNLGTISIAEALYVGTALCELNMSGNRITYDGLISLLDHIQVNTTLKTLWITHNIITKTGFTYIENYIKKMNSSLVIHTSWYEVVMYYKQTLLQVIHVSFNAATISEIVDIPNIASYIWDKDYTSALFNECLKDNDTLQELSYTSIGIPNVEIKRIMEVFKVNKTLIKLNASKCPLYDDAVMALSDSLIHNNTLQELSIADTGINKFSFMMIVNALRSNTTLLKLDASHLLYDNAIGISSYLQNNVTLKELNLMYSLEEHHVVEIMKGLSMNVNTALQKLVISHNNVGDNGAAAIASCLQCNSSLRVLCISNCAIGNIGAMKIAEALKVNTTLQKLDISLNGEALNSDSLTEFSTFLKDNYTLKKVNFCKHQIIGNSEGIQQAVIENCMKLKQLDLSCHHFNTEAIATMCDSIKLDCAVKKLSICNCDITSSGIKRMTETLSDFNHSLKKLDISSNNLSDDGAEAIGDYLSKSSILCELNVSCSGITHVGAVKVAKALKCNTTNTLRKLDISRNSISDDGVAAFGECLKTNNTLLKLDLSYNQITVKSMTIFADAIQENKGLRTLKLVGLISGDNGVMTILHAMYKNKTIMKLYLPGDDSLMWNKHGLWNKVEMINQERTKNGLSVFYTNLAQFIIIPLAQDPSLLHIVNTDQLSML